AAQEAFRVACSVRGAGDSEVARLLVEPRQEGLVPRHAARGYDGATVRGEGGVVILQERELATYRAEKDLRRAVRLVSTLIMVTEYSGKHPEDGWHEDLMLALEHAQ